MESSKNNLRSSASDSLARNGYSEALGRSTEYERTSYESTLRSGGSAVGEMQWVALRDLFTANNLPFTPKYIDFSRLYLLDKALYRRADLDSDLKEGIGRWQELRRDALNAPPVLGSEASLRAHAAQELYITAREDKLASESAALWKPALLCGVLSSIPVFFAFLVARSALAARRRRAETALPAAPVYDAVEPARKPAPSNPPQATRNGGSTAPKRKSDPPQSCVDAARARLTESFGQEISDSILAVLNGKLSNTLARKIADGDFSSLRQLVQSSKKALELRGYDADAIVKALAGEDTNSWPPPASEGPAAEMQPRKRHPLEFMKGPGWKPADFYGILGRYGFRIDEQDGQGHYFIKYKGEKVRGADGRPLVLPARTSGTEFTPGLAKATFKKCAKFLLGLEAGGVTQDS